MDESTLISRLGGLLAGDLIGSAYEGLQGESARPWLTADSCLTDDSLVAVATVAAYSGRGSVEPTVTDFESSYRRCISGAHALRRYFSPDMLMWVDGDSEGGFMEGNGAGIRAATLALIAGPEVDLTDAIAAAVSITHSSEATALAAALADAVSMLRRGVSTANVMEQMKALAPMLSLYSAEHYRGAPMDTTLWWTLPAALHIGLMSDSYSALFDEVLFIGGDTDSIGAMAGAIGHARWGLQGLPNEILDTVEAQLISTPIGTRHEE